ncbi:MAG: EcsC family protein [Bacillota bacterium]|nr:EcsC family protein [Bacillota bacterium]
MKHPWEKEWQYLNKKELNYLRRRDKEGGSFLNDRLEHVVPQKLQSTLEMAFGKAFRIIFEKGDPIIEKSFSKERYEKDYQVRSFAASLRNDRASLKVFRRSSAASSAKNMVMSGVEGVGFGILGVGIPDIPVFVAMILKSIYEISMTYGFSYESREERYFILCVIRASLERGTQLQNLNDRINDLMMKNFSVTEAALNAQIDVTAAVLSRELLYLKFIQGIPIVGVIGGLSDVHYLRCITDYANLKYRRRFLYQRKLDEQMRQNTKG